MTNIIDFYKFKKNKTTLQCDDYAEFMRIKNDHDTYHNISFNKSDTFELFNVSVLNIDENGKYYYRYTPMRIGDMFSDIRLECENSGANMSYVIGGIEIDTIDEFLVCCSKFHEFSIKITYDEKPHVSERITVNYKVHAFNETDVNLLNTVNTVVITPKIMYANGMADPQMFM